MTIGTRGVSPLVKDMSLVDAITIAVVWNASARRKLPSWRAGLSPRYLADVDACARDALQQMEREGIYP